MSDKSSSSSGIGFLGLLTIVFITLKLCHVIDWPWWWVLAPTWGGIALVVLILVIWFLFQIAVIKKRRRKMKGTTTRPASTQRWQQRLEEMQEIHRNKHKNN